MLNNLYPDVVVLAGGGQTPSRPVPPIFPAPPPDYRALLRHPDDFEFSVNGYCVRIWNAAGAAGKGLYYCRAADLDAAEAVKIADSLRSLLVEGQGRARLAAL